MLSSDCVIRIHFRDVSDCSYDKSVDEERLQRQVLVRGFRCPGLQIWSTRISNCCLLKELSLGCPLILSKIQFKKQSIHVGIVGLPWQRSIDLVQNPIQETVDSRRYCQIAVAAVIMGDLNVVCAVEPAHRRQLLSVGSLQTRTMLIPGCAFSRSATIFDVCVDDLVIQANVHFFPIALEG